MGSGTWATWVVLGLIGFVIFSVVRSMKGGEPMHCMTCGTDAPPTKRTRGSIIIEIILWIMLIVPGLIYSIWRLTTKRDVCSSCGAENIIPFSAPAAVAHRKQLQQ